jgi:hypothetical protein
VQNYDRSFELPKKPGRPKKAQKTGKTKPPRRRIDPVMAARARQLKDDGMHWSEIAILLDIPYDPHDPRDRERTRQKIERRIYAGKKLVSEK